MLDKTWLDQNFEIWASYFSSRLKNGFMFYPQKAFYEWLESGEERYLELAIQSICKHISLSPQPQAHYEWGFLMPAQVAGQIRLMNSTGQIQIPHYYVGKASELAAILAHEITHECIKTLNHRFKNTQQLEEFTDFSAMALGFGKLMLNGLYSEVGDQTGIFQIIGYLPPEVRVDIFLRLACRYTLTPDEQFSQLTPQAQKIIETYTKK